MKADLPSIKKMQKFKRGYMIKKFLLFVFAVLLFGCATTPKITREQYLRNQKIKIAVFPFQNDYYGATDSIIAVFLKFGFQVVEAMACGLPIICSCTSSLPEVAKDAAIFVDQNNKQSIADAIVSVIGDRDKRRELSEKSLQQVKKFSWERTTREIVALLESFSKDVL